MGVQTYSMVYDALGRCVTRSLIDGPTTYYIYDGEKPILEYDAGSRGGGPSRPTPTPRPSPTPQPPPTLAGVNLYGKGIDEILERVAIGSDSNWYVYYPQQNHEGSVTLLTDTSGNVIERYRYDAFGAPTIYTSTWATRSNTIYDNRFLFTGREYAATYRSTYTTSAFNFYEYRARAYNPILGRFMSEDPKLFDAGDYNLFRYCHNDPLDFTDPMGLQDTAPTYSPRQTSLERLWEMTKWFDRSNVLQGNFAQFAASQSLSMGQVQQAQSVFMLRSAAIKKYGPYSGSGRWTNESRWITDYHVPSHIINDPDYNWRWATGLGGMMVTHFSVNRDIVGAVTTALNNLQRAGHLGDLHTFDGAFAGRNTRGSGQVSAHAYGLALDINADTAPRGSRALQPLQLRTSFMRAGFVDGGTWVLPWAVRDPMHFTVGF